MKHNKIDKKTFFPESTDIVKFPEIPSYIYTQNIL